EEEEKKRKEEEEEKKRKEKEKKRKEKEEEKKKKKEGEEKRRMEERRTVVDEKKKRKELEELKRREMEKKENEEKARRRKMEMKRKEEREKKERNEATDRKKEEEEIAREEERKKALSGKKVWSYPKIMEGLKERFPDVHKMQIGRLAMGGAAAADLRANLATDFRNASTDTVENTILSTSRGGASGNKARKADEGRDRQPIKLETARAPERRGKVKVPVDPIDQSAKRSGAAKKAPAPTHAGTVATRDASTVARAAARTDESSARDGNEGVSMDAVVVSPPASSLTPPLASLTTPSPAALAPSLATIGDDQRAMAPPPMLIIKRELAPATPPVRRAEIVKNEEEEVQIVFEGPRDCPTVAAPAAPPGNAFDNMIVDNPYAPAVRVGPLHRTPLLAPPPGGSMTVQRQEWLQLQQMQPQLHQLQPLRPQSQHLQQLL
ncbi:hypothetical protein PFISCL1PPCAC_13453, partial [Pristionchus fissidentatus]